MKKLLLFLLIIISQVSFAQIPQSFKYQAVVRDATGLLAVNKIVSIRTSILAGSATGSSAYTETQTLSTNDYGVVSLNIGAGTLVSGNFSTISWGANIYFVKTELDINGGSTYVFMGTSQILSVPYALYSEKTGSSLSDHDTSATNEIQNLSVVGNNLSISNGNTVALPPDADSNPINELQNLSITGDSLHITNGNAVYLSGSIDLDASPTNELQNLSITNGTVTISNGNNIHLPDSSATNELQNLNIANGTLSITNGNNIHLPDSSATNEVQNLSLNGRTITISQSNSITLSDNDSTNEMQTLLLNQGSLSISNRNTIHLPDSSATNELQTLIISHDSISITQGNTIYINTTRSLKFPEGIDGTPITLLDISGTPINYTVPSGKSLYLTNQWSNGCYVWGNPVFPAGTSISLTNSQLLTGLLVDQTLNIQTVSTTVSSTSIYTVPNGKDFYLKNYSDNCTSQVLRVTLPTGATFSGPFNAEVLILPVGTILFNNSTSLISISGYLK